MPFNDLSLLEKQLNYRFRDPGILKTALTHSSYVNEHRMRKPECNERLEFFGDAILEMLTSRYLFKTYPDSMEGDMSKMRASIVSEKALSECARKIGLGDFLILGNGMEKSGGRKSDALLSDAFEALLAAIYLDGGADEVEALVEKLVFEPLATDHYYEDYKTILQELVQGRHGVVTYELLREEGPENNRLFEYRVLVGGEVLGRGTGKSKKDAQTAAAKEAYLKHFQDGSKPPEMKSDTES